MIGASSRLAVRLLSRSGCTKLSLFSCGNSVGAASRLAANVGAACSSPLEVGEGDEFGDGSAELDSEVHIAKWSLSEVRRWLCPRNHLSGRVGVLTTTSLHS